MIKINFNFRVKWEKTKIKKDFNIDDIEKKFDFIKKNYTSQIIPPNLTVLYTILTSPYSSSNYREILNFFFFNK